MSRTRTLAPTLATLAFVLAFGSPAHAAGKADRARAAIATAEGKIQAGDAAGVQTVLPARQAEARKLLNTAKEDLAAGHKEDAVAAANQASAVAEGALGEAQKRKDAEADAQAAQAAAAQRQADAARQQAALARQQAAAADQQRAQAEATTQTVQQQVADANSRAADAQIRAAAAEQAAANVTQGSGAQVETTVTTESKPAAKPVHKTVRTKVVRRTAPKKPAHTVASAETKTTVTQTVTH